ESPYGTTVAHGFLVLSLVSGMFDYLPGDPPPGQPRATKGINYGIDSLRFPAPVPAGSRIRARRSIEGAGRLPGGGVRVTSAVTVDVEDGDKPGCVFQSVMLLFP
ncbi:MAG: MaoC/PaaZ C-terminal domain-containing protein, partial [Sphingomonadales bacterium]